MYRRPATLVVASVCAFLVSVALATAGDGTSGDGRGSAAKPGTISGKVKGKVPSPKKNEIVVEALDLQTAGVVASKRLTSLSFALQVPPGIYVVVAEARELKRGRVERGASEGVRVRSGRRARANVAIGAGSERLSRASRDHRSLRQAVGSQTKVFGVDPGAKVSGMPDTTRGPYTIDDDIEGALAGVRCPSAFIQVRVLDPWILKLMRRELELMGKKPQWIEHRYLVRAGGAVKNGRASLHAEIFDRSTGRVIARVSVAGSAQGRGIWDVEQELARRLAAKACFPVKWTGIAEGTATDEYGGAGSDVTDTWSFNGTDALHAVPADEYEEEEPELYPPGEVEAYYEGTGTIDWTVSGSTPEGQAFPCTTSGSGTTAAVARLVITRIAGDAISSWPFPYEGTSLQYRHQLVPEGSISYTETCTDTDGTTSYTQDVSPPCDAESDLERYELEYALLPGSRTYNDYCDVEWGWGLTLEE